MTESATPPADRVRSLAVTGEVDIANADDLVARAFDELDAAPEILEVDLGDVTFIDSSGLGALVRIRNEAAGRDIALALVRVPPSVQRILQVSGLTDAFEARAGD